MVGSILLIVEASMVVILNMLSSLLPPYGVRGGCVEHADTEAVITLSLPPLFCWDESEDLGRMEELFTVITCYVALNR